MKVESPPEAEGWILAKFRHEDNLIERHERSGAFTLEGNGGSITYYPPSYVATRYGPAALCAGARTMVLPKGHQPELPKWIYFYVRREDLFWWGWEHGEIKE